MSQDRLLQHFESISEAEDAMPRLRRFILDLAVRGKLLEQRTEDEPASELLKKIQKEKARLEGLNVSKNQASQPLEMKQLPFAIPANWCWSQLSEVGVLNPRIEAKDSTKASFAPMSMIFADYGKPNRHEVRLWRDIKKGFTQFAEGDVGLAKITPCFENGKSTVFRNLEGGIGAGTTELHIVRPILVLADFILIFLKSPHFIETGIPKMTGSAGQKRVPKDYFAFSAFPLPPLAEQHRIVAKVDELMALCDELEAARTKRETRRDRLVAASLHRLNNGDAGPEAGNCTDSEETTHFYFNHFPRLTTRPEHIKQLRQSIRALAVHGRLVPQNPMDDPILKLFKQGTAQDVGSAPFLIPASWAWMRVADIAESRLGKMLDKAKNKGTPRRYLRNVNVRWFDFDLSDVLEMRFEDSELDEFMLRRGDALICEGGEPGRAAVWDGRETDIYFQKAIHRVRFPKGVDPYYFVNVIRESADSGRLARYFTGVGIKHFTGKGLASFLVPLPPLAEQHRIVAKTNELTALCDELEAQLTATATTRRQLLEAMLHEAITDKQLSQNSESMERPNRISRTELRG